MALSASQRARINRQNAQHSTGPKTVEGKQRSRQNALTHGLRAVALSLPNEDPTVAEARTQSWNDYYRPDSPAAQHLVNQCVQATLLADRIHRCHTATLTRQIRHARIAWEERYVPQPVDYGRLAELDFPVDRLQRAQVRATHAGLQWMLDSWATLRQALDTRGFWDVEDLNLAIVLCGHNPDGSFQGYEGAPAYRIRMYNFMARPECHNVSMEYMCIPKKMPAEIRDEFDPERPLAPEAALQVLRDRMAAEVSAVQALRAKLPPAVAPRDYATNPYRAETMEEAMMLADKDVSQKFLRYHAEARTTFQRVYTTLLQTLQRDAAEGPAAVPEDPAPGESPNEAMALDEPQVKCVTAKASVKRCAVVSGLVSGVSGAQGGSSEGLAAKASPKRGGSGPRNPV